jgi:hypothetical protein
MCARVYAGNDVAVPFILGGSTSDDHPIFFSIFLKNLPTPFSSLSDVDGW